MKKKQADDGQKPSVFFSACTKVKVDFYSWRLCFLAGKLTRVTSYGRDHVAVLYSNIRFCSRPFVFLFAINMIYHVAFLSADRSEMAILTSTEYCTRSKARKRLLNGGHEGSAGHPRSQQTSYPLVSNFSAPRRRALVYYAHISVVFRLLLYVLLYCNIGFFHARIVSAIHFNCVPYNIR